MAAQTEGAHVSLRPMSLRPGGGTGKNPFERFARGAGYAVKAKAADVQPAEEQKKKPRSEMKLFTREQLEVFQELNVKCPSELTNFPELQINTIEAQRPLQTDDRDWRGRAEQPAAEQDWQKRQAGAGPVPNGDEGWSKGDKPAAGQAAPSRAASGAAPPAAPLNPQALKIQRAEDVGRTAWQKGATQEGNKRTLKEIKGILNKLTPEKFDTLSKQLLQLVTNPEVLQGTITLIFENAVAQPTFVAVYGSLCDCLAKALPDSLAGADRSQTFKRILLNTCQEEFEGAADARTMLATLSEADRPEAERRAKLRTLGNIRLIAELFNRGIIAEKIVVMCVEQLAGDPRADPVDDNVEALCELMTNAGKKLEATTKNRPKFEGFFLALERLAKSKKLPPRIRFMIRDVLDLRKSSWIPRRDVLQAKKIDEIHAEAHAELGMVQTPALPVLQSLPALPAVGPAPQDVNLFPAFRGGDAGWEASGKLKGTKNVGGKQQSSAFFLDVDPLASTTAAKASAAGKAAPAAAAPAAPSKRAPLESLTDDERESRAKSLYSEYLSSRDFREATECVEELDTPGFAAKLVAIGVARMLDAMQLRDQQALAELLVRLAASSALKTDDFVAGLRKHLDHLDDIRIDVPVAPKALGYLMGLSVADGVTELRDFPELIGKVEEAESKRLVGAAFFRTLKEKLGDEKLGGLASSAALDTDRLFAADPELDSPDLPPVATFLEAEGLAEVFA